MEAIWVEVVGQALIRYRIDLSLVFYDLTAFHFEGAYKNSSCITFGFTRTHKGKKQRKLALNVTAKEKFPFLYQLLDGNVAGVSTVQANMQRPLNVLQERGWPVKAVLVVGDRAMLSIGWWPRLPGCSWPTLPERQVVLRPRWEKIAIPLLS